MSVKTKRRGRPGRDQDNLTAEAIVECARTLMQESGKVPSIRQVAGQLEIDPMAIYHYFKSKAALLEAVAVSLMESIHTPSGGAWQDELRALCLSYLRLLQGHAGLLETMLSMDSAGPATVFIRRFQTILTSLVVSDQIMKDAAGLLADYLHGFALAMRCNWSGQELTCDMIEGPLSLFMRGLEGEIQRG